MSGLDIRRQPPTSGKPVYKHEYERTAFDYTTIVFAYVFAPVGFILPPFGYYLHIPRDSAKQAILTCFIMRVWVPL